MRVYDLLFTDGKSCRHIVPDPQPTEAEELRITQMIFCGRLAAMTRIIAPPPDKLPWKRVANDRWEMPGFTLYRCEDQSKGKWCLAFLDRTIYANESADISAAVRNNWANVV